MRSRLGAVLFVCASLRAQTRPSGVYIAASEPRILAGATSQLTGWARASDGSLLDAAEFAWTSANTSILTVDSKGLVTASNPGITEVTATYLGVRGSLRLQVLPARIEVTPGNLETVVGETVQFSATALALDGSPVTTAALNWTAVGPNGGNNNAVTVRGGQVYAGGEGQFTIRATLSYSSGPGQFLQNVSGQTTLTIRPRRSHKVTRLMSSADTRDLSQLRAVRTTASFNSRGEAAFVGSMDGMSTALLTLDAAGIRARAFAGAPGYMVGAPLVDFEDPVLSDSGEIAVRASFVSASRALMKIDAFGMKPWLIEDTYGLPFDGVTSIALSPDAWGPSSELAFRADFRDPGSAVRRNGLFRYSDIGGLTLELDTRQNLPGAAAGTYSFSRRFGFGSGGTLIFQVEWGSNRAVYRKNADGTFTRLFGTGEPVAGVPMTSLGDGIRIGSGGRVGAVVSRADGTTYAIQMRDTEPARLIAEPLSCCGFFHGFNRNGAALLRAVRSEGEGLFVWSGPNSWSPAILFNERTVPGEPFVSFTAGAVLDDGSVVAQARRASNPLVFAKVNSTGITVVGQAGLQVRAGGGPFPFRFVPGSSSGPAILQFGADRRGFGSVSGGQISMKLGPGDRPAGGATYDGAYQVRRASSGDLLVGSDGAFLTMGDSGSSVVSTFPRMLAERTLFAPFQYGGNAAGVLAAMHNASTGQVLCLWSQGSPRIIAYSSGSPQPTPLPAGGTLARAGDSILVDPQGRVTIIASAAGGPASIVRWDGTSWQALLTVGQRTNGTSAITEITEIRLSQSRVIGRVRLANNETQLVEAVPGGAPTVLVSSFDASPRGNALGGISDFDVNSRGDIVVLTSTIGANDVVLYPASGKSSLVYSTAHPGPAFGVLRTLYFSDIRDDGTIYFTGLNLNDEVGLYVAEPMP